MNDGFLRKRPVMRNLVFLCYKPKQAVEQKVEVSVIVVPCRSCDVTVMCDTLDKGKEVHKRDLRYISRSYFVQSVFVMLNILVGMYELFVTIY